MPTILGLNAYHGDAAAAIVVDGQLVAAAEEERFNRVKHSAGFPSQAAAWCLEEAGLSAVEHVAVGCRERSLPEDPRAELPFDAEWHFVEHHLAHLASSFLVSGFDDAAVLSVDAFGDGVSTMLARGSGASLEILERVEFPHSLGVLYTAVTQWLGFPRYGDEGKVMGLAPYGTRRFADGLQRLVRPAGDLFELDLDYFTHHEQPMELAWRKGGPRVGRLFSPRLEELLGPARAPDDELTAHHEDVAASLQAVLEEHYLRLVDALWRRTGLPRLCLAGGVALNAVANGRILRETPFEHVFVQPAASDSGTAIGAAFHVAGTRAFTMEHAYWGPRYSDDECAAALSAAGLQGRRLDEEELCAHVAQRIAAGDVVAWFQGRMELGPRALGNRSILADPRRHEIKDVLNARIKHREPFRPFAPSVLAEQAPAWFEQDEPSPFMVLVYRTRPEKRELIPGVNHVDDTGRLQTVTREANPRYHRLIQEFERLTGVPMVLNTSFDENEPIVMTPADAVETFRRTRIDLLVLGSLVVPRSDGGAEQASEPAALGGQVEAER
ncbi:MAG TPA: carbamoyltransferase C-terminal domain-containing protein [Gaiellaceae bacterium]|nr:carbamoyltransferase C-terminal domain-containing protein [Gaiellaceae bacterium]